MSAPVDKAAALRKQKWRANGLLLLAFTVFLVTLFLPPSLGVSCVKAIAEAAMVGALADWFAVVALFRHPFFGLLRLKHTAVIPSNKDRIAASMAVFVQEKFLDPVALAALVRRSEPADRVAAWLQSPQNQAELGQQAAGLVKRWLGLVDDQRIQAFVADATKALIGRLDMAPALASVLDMLTQGGRHQQVLDELLAALTELLKKPEAREKLAQMFADWARQEHRYTQMALPTNWLADKASGGILGALDTYLKKVADTPSHELRDQFDGIVRRLVHRLRTDEGFQRKGEEIKAWLLHNDALADYVGHLWTSVQAWLAADLDPAAGESTVKRSAERLGAWLGEQLTGNPALRASLNEHMEDLARDLAPKFSDFLARHIRETVEKWDAKELAHQVELQIGPDLQFIRMNGTVVGGIIGLLLFTMTNWRAIWG